MTAAADAGGAPGPVRPFTARVVRQEWAARAVTPMVDALHLQRDRPSVDLPPSAYSPATRAVYVYRIRRAGTDHVGVVADVALRSFAEGRVRGHEAVEPHRVDALVSVYADQPGRAEPVALLHGCGASFAARVDDVVRGEPLLDFAGPDGLEHTLWQVHAEPQAAGLLAPLGEGVHYVADGHHRVAARLRAWDTAGHPADAGVLCVLYPLDGLALSSFHRRVVGPVDGDALLAAAATRFTVTATTGPSGTDGVDLYVAGRWHHLAVGAERAHGVAGLDVTLLQDRLLGPALGIDGPGDPRLEVHPDHVALDALVARCDADGGALFLLRPPALRALTEVADLGQVMPPKSTYFAPKPCAGIFQL
ncbi:DUF1015 family protein [Nocardioides iriomotensis]|uniref:DUF1015 family protein n=1 Tax=Nocardioides iriomotensis TaxID=715784 RepID=A0A4Q5IV83_9ACTN|nr:DUF1015 family protein [Nocardioides iriomotensis]RYU09910.1 DUF1015 family protein [Nocardioides iriomotensis]